MDEVMEHCKETRSDVSDLQEVRLLDLRHNRITATGLKTITKFALGDLRLVSINLSSNPIGDGGMAEIAKLLERGSTLRRLYLYDVGISDKGVIILAKKLSKSELKELDLNSNKIRNRGAQALAGAIKNNNKLEWLDVKYNEISGNGARAIKKAANKELTVDL